MTQEQKAKAYDEALEQARKFHRAFVSGYNYPAADIKASYKAIFPELKESEDERMRKEIIKFLELPHPQFVGKRHQEKWISWLEKQGKEESIDMSIKEKAHQIAWETSKHYDPLLSKESWCEMAALDMASWLEKQGKNADVILAEMRGEGKHKFKIGDIISNGKVVYRVDNIVKNAIGQDCYFLVNVEMEKNGIRYLILTDSEGKTSHLGEITWLCEQVDKSFEKQDTI